MNWDHCSDFGEEDFQVNYLKQQVALHMDKHPKDQIRYKDKIYLCKELYAYAIQLDSYDVDDILKRILNHEK